jgi:protein TonB
MERPLHELAALAAHGKKDRTMSLGLVAGIHVVIIAGLIAGLRSGEIGKGIDVFTVAMVPKRVAALNLLPPQDPEIKPPQQTLPPDPPPIGIDHLESLFPQGDIPFAPPLPPPPPPTLPKEIAGTHTTPPYPPLSQRMGEQGTTALTCEIGTDGKPISCAVTKSSGSERLDEAASSYVKQHYTWVPATRDGKPVADKTQLHVVWDLKNAS